MEIVTIDPGVDFFGIAQFNGIKLIHCDLFDTRAFFIPPLDLPQYQRIQKFYIELPQVYAQRHLKGDPNDLIQLAVVVGQLKQVLGSEKAELVWPHDWKGSVPKKIMLERILEIMTKDEKKLFLDLGLSKSKGHNVLDAIGLGFWVVGRL